MNARTWLGAVCCCVSVLAVAVSPTRGMVAVHAAFALYGAVYFLAHYRGGAS